MLPRKNCEPIKVAIRCRPMSDREKSQKCEKIINVTEEDSSIEIKNQENKVDRLKYDFVFPETSSNEDIYDIAVKPIILGLFDGINGTILAYGYQATGKSYTLKSIIPKSIEEILNFAETHKYTHKVMINMSYYELYINEIRDLLCSNNDPKNRPKLSIHENSAKSYQVYGASVISIQGVEQLLEILHNAQKQKVNYNPNFNCCSSCSHTFLSFAIEIITETKGKRIIAHSNLNFVHFAGNVKTYACASNQVMKEGVSIASTYLALEKCVSTLSLNQAKYVPYRSSNITMLLKESLGGNSRTLLFANINPASCCFIEDKRTLLTAQQVMKVINHPKPNIFEQDVKTDEATA